MIHLISSRNWGKSWWSSCVPKQISWNCFWVVGGPLDATVTCQPAKDFNANGHGARRTFLPFLTLRRIPPKPTRPCGGRAWMWLWCCDAIELTMCGSLGVGRWTLADVVPHEAGFGAQPHLLLKDEREERWLHPSFRVELHRGDTEGYYLNVTSPQPCFWVVWRMQEETSLDNEPIAAPQTVTLSYHDAGRWLNAQEIV